MIPKKFDKSSKDTKLKLFCYNLQQCLLIALLRTSFSKRHLWPLNLTMHDFQTNQPVCCMWYVGTAKRDGNEIASCVRSLIYCK